MANVVEPEARVKRRGSTAPHAQNYHTGIALVTAPDARPYVRMIIERIFPTLPVLSHLEIARGVEIKSLGTVS